MARSDSGRVSPPLGATNNNVLSNPILSESPVSTNQSTPAVRPAADASDRLGSDDTVPPLQLDDIQSAIPFYDTPESNEISATIAFPQDIVAGPGSPQVPSVTITTSHPHSIGSSTEASSPPLHTNTFPEFMPSTVPFPREGEPDKSASTASSALTERDKLTELPASFSAPRLQALTRKAAEASGFPSQDSLASSLIGQHSRRSGDSEHSSFAGKIRGDVTPKRVSFEGDRPSFSSSLQNVRNTFMPASPPDGRSNDVPLSPPNAKSHSSPASIRSPSPLRNFLWPLHRSHSREEPFIPVDPYKLNIFFPPQTIRHVLSQIIRQLYRHLLLRLPSIYFTRVSRVFEDAEVSRPEVQRMIEGRNKGEAYRWPADHEWVAPNVSPALIRFKESWESFVDSVLKEWKTLNVVSALLLTCVVLLPIYGRIKPEIEGASTAPVIRTTAFLSLICALMSLVYGCVYILRFGTMKSMYRASKWAEEAQQATSILWNVWVLLAMPAVWIAWSMLFFCISILDFVWDQPFSSTSSFHDFTTDNSETYRSQDSLAISSLSTTDRTALAPRIVISCVFVLGLIYFALVVRTFRSWGDPRISQVVRESMETGRWTPRSPSPVGRGAPASPRPNRESRFDRPSGSDIDEKLTMKHISTHERRTRSVDSVV